MTALILFACVLANVVLWLATRRGRVLRVRIEARSEAKDPAAK